jgi:beta-lactam-binding protein with PASTA domain
MDERVFAGRYRAVRELSSDATGRTWLAVAPDGDQVVVKVVHPPDAATGELIEHEVDLASGIRHATLPAILEWGHEDGDFFVVREYVGGADLKTELALQGRFAPSTVARYGSQAAEALAQLHSRGLTHGNVRSANLIRLPSDEVKLVGSGLGARDASPLGTSGAPASTAWYLAPERVEGAAPSVASDIYALGAVLYELLTGRPLFDGDSAAEVSDHQIHAMPTPIRELEPDVPKLLDDVVMRALEKSPEERWPSAEEMKAALDRVVQAEAVLPPVEPAPVAKSKAGMWTAIVVLVALGALAAAWALGLFGGGGIAVPDVVGKALPEARAAVLATGLDVGAVTYSGVSAAGIADGLVARQVPAAGSKAVASSTVDLVLAGREMLSVPDVSGVTEAQAVVALDKAGLTVGSVSAVPTTAVAAGVVTSQTPEQGAQAAKGSAVDLWVAQAPLGIAVPDVGGLRQAAANTALVNAGLVVRVVTQSSSSIPSGIVIDQNPSAGVTAQSGATVTIRISSGPARTTVPNVVGKTQASAVNALTNAGFLTQVVLQTGGGTVGTVVDQSPASGARAATGSTVVITVVQ